MKVLSYLEINKHFHDSNKELDENFHFTSNLTAELGFNMSYFYSQPFKPELITELFEIINHQVTDRLTYYHERFEINDIPIDITSHSICYGDYTFESYPRTLDEFITDCQRAGIELTWKETN